QPSQHLVVGPHSTTSWLVPGGWCDPWVRHVRLGVAHVEPTAIHIGPLRGPSGTHGHSPSSLRGPSGTHGYSHWSPPGTLRDPRLFTLVPSRDPPGPTDIHRRPFV